MNRELADQIDVLAKEINQANIEKGFWDEPRTFAHCAMLMVSELSEAVEADRKGKRVDTDAQSAYDLCQKDKFYAYAYDNYIKGTIEEELADVVIRLLDLFGERNIFLDESGFDEETFQDYADIYKDKTFTESVYYIIEELIKHRGSVTESCVLPEIILLDIFGLAKHLNIDLIWQITQKIKYNELRLKMHGKKY